MLDEIMSINQNESERNTKYYKKILLCLIKEIYGDDIDVLIKKIVSLNYELNYEDVLISLKNSNVLGFIDKNDDEKKYYFSICITDYFRKLAKELQNKVIELLDDVYQLCNQSECSNNVLFNFVIDDYITRGSIIRIMLPLTYNINYYMNFISKINDISLYEKMNYKKFPMDGENNKEYIMKLVKKHISMYDEFSGSIYQEKND